MLRLMYPPGGSALSPVTNVFLHVLCMLATPAPQRLPLPGPLSLLLRWSGGELRGLGLSSLPPLHLLPQGSRSLLLANNKLSVLGTSVFANLSSLEELDLSNNYLDNLPGGLFRDMSNLTRLTLHNNSLTGMDRELFQGLGGLQSLDLSLNGLSIVPLGLLDELQSLRWLSLAGNRLHALERAAFEPLVNLQRLELGQNPWECDCNLRDFKHWIEWLLYRGGRVDAVECTLPKDLRGRDIRTVPVEMFNYCLQLEDENGDGSRPGNSGSPCSRSNQNRDAPHSDNSEDSSPSTSGERGRPTACGPDIARQRAQGDRHRCDSRVVCGIVCIMMVAAAAYGCIYASLMAKYQRELKKRQPLMGDGEADGEDREEKQISSVA